MTRATRFRIGNWVFDPATGDLTEGGPGRRLEPQQARLLTLLTHHAGEGVTGEQMRDEFPEASTDFDRELEYCLRQLRSAFDAGAGSPDYFEALPGRGCRLIVEVTPLGPAPAPESDRSALRLVISLAFVLGAITLFWFGPAGRVAERRAEQDRAREEAANRLASPAGRAAGVVIAERPLRVAVLAISEPEDAELAQRLGRLLEGLASDFAAIDKDRLGVVGPVTTGVFVDADRPRAEVGAALGVDYVLSADLRAGEDGASVQLIRVPDGERMFAIRFPAETDVEAIRNTVAAGVLTAIEQDSERQLR